MSALALVNCFSYVGGYDFTTDTNNALLTNTAEAKDGTTFKNAGDANAGWKIVVPGLKAAGYDLSGFWQSATSQAVDPEVFNTFAVSDVVYTVGPKEAQPASPVNLISSERAFMFRGIKTHYELFGEIGEVTPFKLQSGLTQGAGVVNGLQVKAKGTVAATGQLGSTFDTLGFGVAAGQQLWTNLHVFIPGTTITVQVQSDDNTGFSSPTTVGTIGPITTSTGAFLAVNGPITDRYLRLNVSAITGTNTVAAAMGIRP